jgi:hypothetical protein
LKLGDSEAIIPLLKAFDSRSEADKLFLLETMEALEATKFAGQMALQSLLCQKQTSSWEAVMILMLATGDSHVRGSIIPRLLRRKSGIIKRALLRALELESDSSIREILLRGLKKKSKASDKRDSL